jgi:hypothetical protein
MMFCLINDDDGHWYIIPADKRIETWNYFEKLYKYYEEMPEDEEEPNEPDWLVKINTSLSYVTFPSYKIGVG